MVASPAQGEGKGATYAALGMELAKAGQSTLILDCDFRKGSVHEFYGMHNARGMVDVLAGTHRLQEVWEEPVKGLKVIPTGPIPPILRIFLTPGAFRGSSPASEKKNSTTFWYVPPL